MVIELHIAFLFYIKKYLPCSRPGRKILIYSLLGGPRAFASASQRFIADWATLTLLSASLTANACGRSPKLGLINWASRKNVLIFPSASFLTFQFLSASSVSIVSVIWLLISIRGKRSCTFITSFSVAS